MKTPEPWTQAAAIAFCYEVEPLAAQCGAHLALTGGCLYGNINHSRFRKDLDLAIYPHGGTASINIAKLFSLLSDFGVVNITGAGWRYVGYYHGKQIDFLFV